MARRGSAKDDAGRLATVTLDETSLGSSNDDVEHERRVAIYDLIENNKFRPAGHDGGPYALQLGISGNRLVFDIRLTDGTPVIAHMLSLMPFRRLVKDYFVVCDSYYSAIRTATPDRIEALDMARRALARRRLALGDGASQAQGRYRLRHGAAAVHADYGLALEGRSMIRNSGSRFSELTMRRQNAVAAVTSIR